MEGERSKSFNLLKKRKDGLNPCGFPGVHMKNISTDEGLLKLNTFPYVIGASGGKFIGELARQNVQEYKNCATTELQQP